MTPTEMVTSPASHVHGRQATIEAACRVAMRMVGSGRGHQAALQFLLDVAARHLAAAAAIAGEGKMPSLASNDSALGPRSSEPSPGDGLEKSWSVPIRNGQGTTLGELRLRALDSDKLDAAGLKALETIARAAAEIVTRSDPSRPGD